MGARALRRGAQGIHLAVQPPVGDHQSVGIPCGVDRLLLFAHRHLACGRFPAGMHRDVGRSFRDGRHDSVRIDRSHRRSVALELEADELRIFGHDARRQPHRFADVERMCRLPEAHLGDFGVDRHPTCRRAAAGLRRDRGRTYRDGRHHAVRIDRSHRRFVAREGHRFVYGILGKHRGFETGGLPRAQAERLAVERDLGNGDRLRLFGVAATRREGECRREQGNGQERKGRSEFHRMRIV